MTKADDGSEAFVMFFIAFVLSRAGFEPALSRCMTQISTFLIVTLVTRFVFARLPTKPIGNKNLSSAACPAI